MLFTRFVGGLGQRVQFIASAQASLICYDGRLEANSSECFKICVRRSVSALPSSRRNWS